MAAALMVVLYHGDEYVKAGSPLLQWGLVGVEFFMVLSGYVLSRPFFEGPGANQRRLGAISFLRRRAYRILPAYWAVLGIATIAGVVGIGPKELAPPSLGWQVATHALLVQGLFPDTLHAILSPLWSLSLEWQYYLAFPLLVWLCRRLSAVQFIGVVAVVSMLTRVAIVAQPHAGYLLNGFFLARVTEFASGVALAALFGRSRGARSPLLAFVTAQAFAVVSATLGGLVFSEFVVQAEVFSLILLLRWLGPTATRSRVLQFVQFLGVASYSTYLVHALAGPIGVRLAVALTGTTSIGVLLIVFVVAGHVAGVLFHLAIEAPLGAQLGQAPFHVHRTTAGPVRFSESKAG